MVEEVYAHDVAGFVDPVGELVVEAAGMVVATRVVVCRGYDGGIVGNRRRYVEAYVDGSLGDAAVAYAHSLYEFEVLVHEQYPRLLHVEVLHPWVHVVVYVGGGAKA